MNEHYNEIIARIGQLLSRQERVIVAIDGGTAAGTEYWAEKIARNFDGNLFHTADFCAFEMPDEGTYLDCGRLHREVLEPVKKGIPFFFQPCGKKHMEAVAPQRLNIVEGTFALHRQLRDVYDLKIMLRVDPTLQQRHLNQLDPEMQLYYEAQRLPAEALYFHFTAWEKHCDFIVDAQDVIK